jgi:predicted transcriptional regulator
MTRTTTSEAVTKLDELINQTQIESRQSQQDFIARGLASRDEARITGKYFDSDELLAELDEMLADAETKAST